MSSDMSFQPHHKHHLEYAWLDGWREKEDDLGTEQDMGGDATHHNTQHKLIMQTITDTSSRGGTDLIVILQSIALYIQADF